MGTGLRFHTQLTQCACADCKQNGGETCYNMPFKDREMRLFFDGGGLFSFSLVHYYTMYHESKMVVTEANDKVMAVNVL